MDTKFSTTLVMAMFLMVLTGCVSKGTAWKRHGVTADQFAADKTTCKGYAHRKTEYAYSNRADLNGTGGVNNNVQYKALMQRHDARQDARIQFERCLMRRGYQKFDPNAAAKKK